MKRKKHTTVVIDAELWAAARLASTRRGTSIKELVERFIEQDCGRELAELRQTQAARKPTDSL
jgi:hypothetical protein